MGIFWWYIYIYYISFNDHELYWLLGLDWVFVSFLCLFDYGTLTQSIHQNAGFTNEWTWIYPTMLKQIHLKWRKQAEESSSGQKSEIHKFLQSTVGSKFWIQILDRSHWKSCWIIGFSHKNSG
jgi:hypothetical protein